MEFYTIENRVWYKSIRCILLRVYHKYITSLIKLSCCFLSFDETTYIYILLMKYMYINLCMFGVRTDETEKSLQIQHTVWCSFYITEVAAHSII